MTTRHAIPMRAEATVVKSIVSRMKSIAANAKKSGPMIATAIANAGALGKAPASQNDFLGRCRHGPDAACRATCLTLSPR